MTTTLEAIERVLSHASVRFVAPIMRWMHATIVNGNVSAAGAQESVILELHDVRATRWLQWENGSSELDNGVGMMGTLLQRHRQRCFALSDTRTLLLADMRKRRTGGASSDFPTIVDTPSDILPWAVSKPVSVVLSDLQYRA